MQRRGSVMRVGVAPKRPQEIRKDRVEGKQE